MYIYTVFLIYIPSLFVLSSFIVQKKQRVMLLVTLIILTV